MSDRQQFREPADDDINLTSSFDIHSNVRCCKYSARTTVCAQKPRVVEISSPTQDSTSSHIIARRSQADIAAVTVAAQNVAGIL